MKIKEILNEALVNPEYSKDEPLQYNYDLDDLYQQRVRRSDDQTNLNRPGWYSYGKETEDPHEYNVQTHLPSDIDVDAKYIWVNTVSSLMGDNPYLPVYYKVNLKPDKKGDSRVSYTMERLYDVNQIRNMYLSTIDARPTADDELEANIHTSKLLVSMIARVMGVDKARKIKSRYAPLTNPSILWEDFVEQLEKSVSLLSVQRTTLDPDMTKALDIVNFLREKYGFTIDIHSGNVMLRNTSRGLVPVITDPLSDDGRSIIGRKY